MTLPEHQGAVKASSEGSWSRHASPLIIRAASTHEFTVTGALTMRCRPAFLGLALAALSMLTVSASPTRMSVDEIRPGMIGIGHTVFEGDRIEEFKVQF